MPKKVTLKDIAKEAGVSAALVSFVMNNRLEADGRQKYRVGESTRQRILDVARRMNYKPASRVLQRAWRNLVIAVLLPGPQLSDFASELERLAVPEGCTFLYGYTMGDHLALKRLLDVFLDRKVDALVVATEEEELLEEFRRRSIPCVVADLSQDALSAARQCASTLLQLV